MAPVWGPTGVPLRWSVLPRGSVGAAHLSKGQLGPGFGAWVSEHHSKGWPPTHDHATVVSLHPGAPASPR